MIKNGDKGRGAPRAVGEYLLQITIVFVAYFVAGKLGQATTNIRSSNLGPVWPAYGIALAAILLWGYRVWVGVATAAFLVAFLSPVPVAAAVGQATGATLAAVAGAFLLRRVARFHTSLSRLRDALGLIVLGGFGSALVSASIGVSVLYATHVQAYSGISSAWLIYWLGDASGVLLVTPLVLAFPNLLKIRPRARIAELVALLMLLTTACFVVFSDLPLIPIKLHVLAFALLPFVMWAAIRFGVSGAALAALFIAAIATTETAFGSGPFAQNTPFINAVLLDVFFAVLSVTGMTLAAVIAEREHAERERERMVREQAAMEARLRLATIVESCDDAIIGKDIDGIITDWNKGAERLYGYRADEVIGKPASLLMPPDRSVDFAAIMEVLSGGDPIKHFETVCQRKDGTRVEVSLTISPIRDGEGRFVGASAIERDITERKRQEAILLESEGRFRLVADTAPVLIWMSGTDKLCTYFNKPWLDFTGRSMEEELGDGWVEGVHPEDLRGCLDTYGQSFDRHEEFRMEYRLRRHDGEYRWMFDIGTPRFNHDGSFAGYIGSCLDVTDRKLASRELALANDRLRLAMEAGTSVGWDLDVKSGRDLWFGNLQTMFGIPSETHMTSAGEFIRYVHPDDRQRVSEAITDARQNRKLYAPEFRVVRRDGAIRWLAARGKFYYAANGAPERMLGVSLDVTERKLAEEALQESEQRLHLAVQAGRMYAYEWNIGTDLIVRSAECIDILGAGTPTRTTRQQMLALIHPDDRGKFTAVIAGLTKENPTVRFEYRAFHSDGSVLWLEKTARAFFDGEGRVVRMVGMVADVTDRKRAEEARFKHTAIVESSDDAIISMNLEGVIVSWNTGAQRIFGFTEADAVGQPIAIIVPPELREEENRLLQKLRAGERVEHYETIGVTKAGREVNVSLMICPLKDSTGRVIGGSKIARDITQRKQTLDKLRKSEERFRLAAQAGKMFAYEWDAASDVIVRSAESAQILGIDEAAHITGKQILAKVHPEDQQRLTTAVAELSPQKPYLQISYRMIRPNGSVIWVERNSRAHFDEQGRMLRIVGMVADVTERKQVEEALASVSRRLIEAQEQERARIARELHDDTNQRLAMLAIGIEQLKNDVSDRTLDVRRRLDELREQTLDISKDVQAMSHKLHSSKLDYLGLVVAMRGFCKEFSEQQKVEIDFRSHDVPSPVPPDIALCLFRVLQEALHNSAKHSGAQQFKVQLWGTLDEIHLAVSDSGTGFEPKAAMMERGLGLISMQERVQLMKGTFSIESRPKRGTTIRARIPLIWGSDSMRAAG